MHRHTLALSVAAVCAVLLSVLPRAVTQVTSATSRYAEQRKAILAACEAERTRLGLTQAQADKKYPTPEVQFPPELYVVPNDAQAFEWKGPFLPGTKFLFTSDDVEVVKEDLTKTAYLATLRISPAVGPGPVGVTGFNPVSGRRMGGQAMYVGGRHEWNMKAANGWQLKMKTLGTPWKNDNATDQMGVPHQLEFIRPGETKPFQVLDTSMYLSRRVFSGNLRFNGGDPDSTAEEIKSVQEQLKDPALDTEELQKQLAELKKQQQAESVYGKLEVECSTYRMWHETGGTYAIEVNCGDSKVGTLKASGNVKFIGP